MTLSRTQGKTVIPKVRGEVRMAAWSTLFALCCGLGCGGTTGPERASVSGSVTFDGVPVEKGSIAFIPDGATVGPTAGALIEKGRYQTASGMGPVLGSHRVEITAHRAGNKVDVAGIGGSGAGPSAAGSVQQTEMYIPAQYNTKSTLTVTIKSGNNPNDFSLKSTP